MEQLIENKSPKERHPPSDLNMDVQQLKTAARTLRALHHDLRKRILLLIDQHGQVNVTDIYTQLGLDQSVASLHLAILRREGMVRAQRRRKFVFYSVNYERLTEIHLHCSRFIH